MPPSNVGVGYWIHSALLSVCPAVYPSVRSMCSLTDRNETFQNEMIRWPDHNSVIVCIAQTMFQNCWSNVAVKYESPPQQTFDKLHQCRHHSFPLWCCHLYFSFQQSRIRGLIRIISNYRCSAWRSGSGCSTFARRRGNARRQSH